MNRIIDSAMEDIVSKVEEEGGEMKKCDIVKCLDYENTMIYRSISSLEEEDILELRPCMTDARTHWVTINNGK